MRRDRSIDSQTPYSILLSIDSLKKKLFIEYDFRGFMSEYFIHMKHIRSARFFLSHQPRFVPNRAYENWQTPFRGHRGAQIKAYIRKIRIPSALLIFRAVNFNPRPGNSYYSTGIRWDCRVATLIRQCIRFPSQNKRCPISPLSCVIWRHSWYVADRCECCFAPLLEYSKQ